MAAPNRGNSPKKSNWSLIVKFWKKGRAFLAGLVLLFGAWQLYEYIKTKYHEKTTSPHDLFKEKNSISGIFVPPNELLGSNKLVIKFGESFTSFDKTGMDDNDEYIPNASFALTNSTGNLNLFSLSFKLNKNLLFIHAILTDFDRKKIGEINFDKWESANYYPGDFVPSPNDDGLTVMDNMGNVAFKMKYLYGNIIKICGYDVGDSGIAVIHSDIIRSFDWPHKEDALREIRENSYAITHYPFQ